MIFRKNKDLESHLRELKDKEIDFRGRVINSKGLSARLSFLMLRNGDEEIQVVCEGDGDHNYRKGDIVQVSGILKESPKVKKGVKGYEVLSQPKKIQRIFDSKESKSRDKFEGKYAFTEDSNSKLIKLKSKFLRSIRERMYADGYIEVCSPSIVGEICKGPVPDFQVSFFGREASLSVSNILYHQIIIASGFDSIYEINKVFRGSKSETSRHVSEIQMMDLTTNNMDIDKVVSYSSDMVRELSNVLEENGIKSNLMKDEKIPVFKYEELIEHLRSKNVDVSSINQPHDLRTSIEAQKVLPLYIWITDCPAENYNFFSESYIKDGKRYSRDAQLRYVRGGQLMSGAQRNVEKESVLNSIKRAGYDPRCYGPYLEALDYGIIPNAGMSLGVDRMFSALTGSKSIKDVIMFPRDTSNKFLEER